MKINLTRLLDALDERGEPDTTGEYRRSPWSETSSDKAYAFEINTEEDDG